MNFFSNLTIGKRLTLLSSFLVFTILFTNWMSSRSLNRLSHELQEVAEVQLPAIRAATTADMYHDGIRAVAFRSIIVSSSSNPEEKKEVHDEMIEFSENLRKQFKVVEDLHLSPTIDESIGQIKGPLEAYIGEGKILSDIALAGNTREAFAKIPEFQKRFKELEASMEKFGDLIEKGVEEAKNKGEADTKESTRLNWLFMLIGSIGGAALSWWIVRDLLTFLKGAIGRLNQESVNVTHSSTSVSSTSQDISQATVQQASAIQQTAASIEQITAMVRKTSENAKSLERAAQGSQSSAKEGQDSVNQLLTAIENINTSNAQITKQVEDSNQQISEIVKVISEIGNKTKVINDIVFQTKLLSFNASVEAARAGEHGKGFAVVAEEVGNLAQMSGTAAKEIADMLSSSIQKVEGIVVNTRSKVDVLVADGKQKLETGTQVAQKTGQALGNIVRQVDDVGSMINEITIAIGEQNLGIAEISKAMNQLDQTTQENARTANQASETSQGLLEQSRALNQIVTSLETITGLESSPENHMESAPSSPTAKTFAQEGKRLSTKSSNVIPMTRPASKKPSVTTSKPSPKSSPIMAKAVGDDALPSENDPRFKDI